MEQTLVGAATGVPLLAWGELGEAGGGLGLSVSIPLAESSPGDAMSQKRGGWSWSVGRSVVSCKRS